MSKRLNHHQMLMHDISLIGFKNIRLIVDLCFKVGVYQVMNALIPLIQNYSNSCNGTIK